MGGGIGAAITGFVVKTNLTFEKQFNQLRAFTIGATEEQHQTLRRQSLELGATTSRSAIQSAAAQTELASAGFTTNEILAATPDILNVAIAGTLSMGEAASLVTSQVRAYGLEAEDAGRVTDVFGKDNGKRQDDTRRAWSSVPTGCPVRWGCSASAWSRLQPGSLL